MLKTINGGQFWDDLTANLPEAVAHGVTADPGAGVVYVATGRGLLDLSKVRALEDGDLFGAVFAGC